MRKHVVYLTYDGLTDPLGQSQVLPYILGVEAMGIHRFTIVSFEKPENFEKEKGVIQDLIRERQIRWIPNTYHRNPPIISTLFDVIRLWKKVRELVTKDSAEIVHCRSYVTALVGLQAKKKFGSQFIFDMRGFWADERVEGGIWNLKNPAYRLVYDYFKRKERLFLREADHVVTLTFKARDIINSWAIKPGDLPVTVIPCCVDMDHFDPEKVDPDHLKELREDLRIGPDEFVLTYVGSLGTWYMVEEMVMFFSKMLNSQPLAKFLLLTKDDPEGVLRIARRLKIPLDSIMVRPVSRSQMPAHIALSSFSIFFIKPVFSKQASSPTKMGEIMAMGVPIIANKGIGDSDNYISREMGVMVDVEGPAEINVSSQRLLAFSANSNLIRNRCKAVFSLDVGVDAYFSIYNFHSVK